MKILLVTETWDITTGPYETFYPALKQVLERLGHQIRAVDNKQYHPMWQKLKLDRRTPRYSRKIYFLLTDWLVNRELRRVAGEWQPDLILLFKCENISWRTTAWLKEHTHAILFNWDWDNPFWPDNTTMDLLYSIQLYDGFGVLTKVLVSALYTLNCKRVEYLPMFFSPERFPANITARPELQCDLAFVGNPTPKRLAMLRQLIDFDLGLWGNWGSLDKDDPLRAKVRGPQINGIEYAQVMRSCKIAMNVLNLHNRFGNNLRTFEATGMGAMLLTEYSQEQAEDLFIENKEIACFRSPEELRDKATYYLSHETNRRQLAQAGQQRTLRDHTLEQRLLRILEVTQELGPQ